jgi:hypothetical protein
MFIYDFHLEIEKIEFERKWYNEEKRLAFVPISQLFPLN